MLIIIPKPFALATFFTATPSALCTAPITQPRRGAFAPPAAAPIAFLPAPGRVVAIGDADRFGSIIIPVDLHEECRVALGARVLVCAVVRGAASLAPARARCCCGTISQQ